jgi:hypothetical protein
MPFYSNERTTPCLVCQGHANVYERASRLPAVNCSLCGDFRIDQTTIDDWRLPFTEPKQQALARQVIRKMTASGTRPLLTNEFFQSLRERTLPTPAEASDNLLLWIAEQADDSPGRIIDVNRLDDVLYAIVGVKGGFDIEWIVNSLVDLDLFQRDTSIRAHIDSGRLTAFGWQRVDALKRAHVSSKYAFFARKFKNPDLDRVFKECLVPAVKQTGYELRIASEEAGLIDALIEDGIRRCRFLIADLSDDNGGAYWEAGFAHGLGKPVIYICREGVIPHFDTDHHQTVWWDLPPLDATASLDATAKKLKAVIRNTLLGDAKQED